ncbi:MAG TPA: hypothetical protein VFL30_02780 [Rhodanobacteraceae bacterium]|nr:hypothetical protein [Rhodanobacteraceae bacterium]
MRYLIVATLASLALAVRAPAQSIDTYAPAPGVPPASIARQADGKMLIVGSFADVGADTRTGIARLDVDGSVDVTFGDAEVDGNVMTVAVQADGAILIGGGFTEVGGQPRHSLARLHADGTLDATFADPGFNGNVEALAIQPDGRILVGGTFTMIGTHAQNYFVRLDANGGFDASFADPELCCDPLVDAIALQADGSVLIGGAFSEAGGVNGHFYFARFSASGVFDPSFPAITTFPQPAALMVAPDGSIYVSNGGVSDILKLDASGAPVAGFSSAIADGAIDSFALQPDGRILIAGTFQNVGGVPRHALARLTADGSLDQSFGDLHFDFNATDPNGYIYGIADQSDGKPVVVGNFSRANGAPQMYVARVATGDFATSTLVVQPVGADVVVTWYRLGDGPELAAPPTLLHSSDGVTFSAIGTMTRVANGWQASVPYDAHGARFYLKALGETSDGTDDASPGTIASAVYSNDTIFADGFE